MSVGAFTWCKAQSQERALAVLGGSLDGVVEDLGELAADRVDDGLDLLGQCVRVFLAEQAGDGGDKTSVLGRAQFLLGGRNDGGFLVEVFVFLRPVEEFDEVMGLGAFRTRDFGFLVSFGSLYEGYTGPLGLQHDLRDGLQPGASLQSVHVYDVGRVLASAEDLEIDLDGQVV